MNNNWRTAVISSEIDLTGFQFIDWARVDINGDIITTIGGLIDRETQSGVLVEKYFNATTSSVAYILADEVVSEQTVDLADIWVYSQNYVYPESWIYSY